MWIFWDTPQIQTQEDMNQPPVKPINNRDTTQTVEVKLAIKIPQGFENLSLQDKILSLMVLNNASDAYPVVGYNISIKITGKIISLENTPILTDEEISNLIKEITTEKQFEKYKKEMEMDFAYEWNGYRFRINIFHQQKHPSLTIRYLRNDISSIEQLGLPSIITELARKNSGIILVCWVTGSGKSTTLSAMVDYINENFAKHIITIEDPVEYTYTKKKSIIEQREVSTDTESFASAMKSALRQNPNVLLLWEMRDLESIASAISIAESWHLVLATIHARNSVQCINKIIDAFPAAQQNQVRTQLSEALCAIMTQKLIPWTDWKLKLVMEIMINNHAIANMIRENQTHQIESSIQTGKNEGMKLLDEDIRDRLNAWEITFEEAKNNALKPADFT